MPKLAKQVVSAIYRGGVIANGSLLDLVEKEEDFSTSNFG